MRVYLTESQFKSVMAQSIRQSINEVHVAVIDGMATAEKIIRAQWSNPDDFWYVKIDQRYKDWRHRNQRMNGNGEWWKRCDIHNHHNALDATDRENHVGYAIISGNTIDEVIESLHNIEVHVHHWARKKYGFSKVIQSTDGNMDALKNVCDVTYSRAYMTLNKRSMAVTTNCVNNDIKKGNGNRRSFNYRAGQQMYGMKGSHDWDKERPWTLIDCDIDDINAQQELRDYLSQNGINAFAEDPSHDGMHYIFDKPDVAKLDFSKFNKYNTQNRKGDPNVLAKRDANMILYSSCGK